MSMTTLLYFSQAEKGRGHGIMAMAMVTFHPSSSSFKKRDDDDHDHTLLLLRERKVEDMLSICIVYSSCKEKAVVDKNERPPL